VSISRAVDARREQATSMMLVLMLVFVSMPWVGALVFGTRRLLFFWYEGQALFFAWEERLTSFWYGECTHTRQVAQTHGTEMHLAMVLVALCNVAWATGPQGPSGDRAPGPFGEEGSWLYHVLWPYIVAYVAIAFLLVVVLREQRGLVCALRCTVLVEMAIALLALGVVSGPRVTSLMGGKPADRAFELFVHRVADEVGVPRPAHVYVIPTREPNAFASGMVRHDVVLFNRTLLSKDTTVAVTDGLRSALSKSQLKAVLGHELAHIHMGDVATSTNLALIVVGMGAVHTFGQHLYDWGVSHHDDNMTTVGIAFIAGGAIMKMTADVYRFSVSRDAEYRADSMSAAKYGHEAMAGALLAVHNHALSTRRDLLGRLNGAVSHACIAPDPAVAAAFGATPRRGLAGRWQRLFHTHPTIEDRVSLLRTGTLSEGGGD
tara:strand:+ start:2310 stop:3608 length:1299 start_codon:yes stop_codon:yes gene_type:complete